MLISATYAKRDIKILGELSIVDETFRFFKLVNFIVRKKLWKTGLFTIIKIFPTYLEKIKIASLRRNLA